MSERDHAFYAPQIFDVGTDLAAARRVILSDEEMGAEERWRVETPYLVDLIFEHVLLSPASLVLDYGCGVGRLSRPLTLRAGCRVVGTDISYDMLALAVREVCSPRFIACGPPALDGLGLRFDLALSVWTLQHVHRLHETIAWLAAKLRPGGRLFVVNNRCRAVPTDLGWVDDGLDVAALLDEHLDRRETIPLDPAILSRFLVDRTLCGVWEAR